MQSSTHGIKNLTLDENRPKFRMLCPSVKRRTTTKMKKPKESSCKENLNVRVKEKKKLEKEMQTDDWQKKTQEYQKANKLRRVNTF